MKEIILIGLAALSILIILTSLFSRKITSSFIILVAIYTLHLILPAQIPIEYGVTIHIGDIVFGALAIGTAIRLLSMERIAGLPLLWLLVCLALGASFAHGVLQYGLLTAAASYRSSLYLCVGTMYFASFRFNLAQTQSDLDWITRAGFLLVLATVLMWLEPQWRPLGSDTPLWSPHIYERARVLPAQAALFLALAALASLPAWMETNGSLLTRLLGLLALITAISLLHRTVWVALAAAMMPFAIFSGKKASRALLLVQIVIIILAVLWLLLVGLDMDIFSSRLSSAVAEATEENNNTLNWRIEGWRVLVDAAIADGPLTILLGSGFGIGFARTIAREYITVSPHNYYIELFLTSGLVGCGLYLYACLATLMRTIRHYQYTGQPQALALAGMVIVVLVYGGAYTPQFDVALLLGLAMSLPPQQPRARQPSS